MQTGPKPNLNPRHESPNSNATKNRGKLAKLALTLILLIGTVPFASGSSLTLDTAPGINFFNADNWLTSGATVANVPPQPAAFEAYSFSDENNDGVWNSPDGQRWAVGRYDSGLFGMLSLCQSLGAFNAAHQTVRPRGILIIDDLVVTTTDPTPPASIPVSVSFHVSGETSHYNSPVRPEFINGGLDMLIQINGTPFYGEYNWSESSTGTSETVTGLGTQIAGGTFSESFSATVTTGSASVPVNTPFTLRVEFELTTGAGGASGSAYGGMTFDARNTAGFLSGAPVFNNLPTGYTATSVDAGIANNMFGGVPTSVPSGNRSNATWSEVKSMFRSR